MMVGRGNPGGGGGLVVVDVLRALGVFDRLSFLTCLSVCPYQSFFEFIPTHACFPLVALYFPEKCWKIQSKKRRSSSSSSSSKNLIPSSALLTTYTALSLSMSSPSLSHTYVRTPVPTPIFHPEERKVYMFNAGPIEKKNFNFHPSLSFLASLFTMLSASIRLCACGFFFFG